jgi:hypothetical protein
MTSDLHLMQRLRMSGAVPLLPCVPLWLGQGQIYVFLPALIIRRFNFLKILLDFAILESLVCGFELYLYGYLST